MAKSRYYRLTGEATVTQLSNFTLVFLHNEEVNPERQLLKFGTPLKPTSDAPVQDGTIDIILSFDKRWFYDTMFKGFRFKKEDGSAITLFDHLDLPQEGEISRMNPIVP